MKPLKTTLQNIEEKPIDGDAKNVSFISVAKQIAIFLIGFIGIYAITFIAESLIIFAMTYISGAEAIEGLAESNMFLLVMQLVTYSLTLLAIIATINKEITKLFDSFKNLKSYFAGFCCAIGIIGFEVVYTSIIIACGYPLATGGNQSDINEIVEASTAISVLVFGIIGPITEELTYRVGLYSLLRRKNKILALVVTSLIFGFIHIVSHLGDGNIVNELLLLPIYAGSGFFLSYVYEKYGLAGSVTAHIIVNLISLI